MATSRTPLILIVSSTLLLLCSTASAQSIFIPVDFGAAYEPQQLNDNLNKLAIDDGRQQLMDSTTRDDLLNAHFPELMLPNVSELEQMFAKGNEAFFDGDYDRASKQLETALAAAEGHLVSLSLRPGFAETIYQGGLFLIQAYFFVLDQPDKAEVVIERLVRQFPTQVPGDEQFPPDLVELYQRYLPSSANGKNLTINVAEGCRGRVNGHDLLEAPTVTVVVLPGEYGVAEVCDEQTVRAYVVPVTEDTIIDFHDEFANAYTYPISLSLNASQMVDDNEHIAQMLVTLGHRVGVKHIIAAGLVPARGGDSDGYKMMLVDVEGKKLVRQFTVRPADVTNNEGMKDAINSLWTGEAFSVITDINTQPNAVSWTTIGLVSLGTGGAIAVAGGVCAILAMQADDDFQACTNSYDCRSKSDGKDMTNALKDRWKMSVFADALYGAGAAFVIAGAVMVIADQSGGSKLEGETSSWNLGLAPTPDGGVVGFSMVW